MCKICIKHLKVCKIIIKYALTSLEKYKNISSISFFLINEKY